MEPMNLITHIEMTLREIAANKEHIRALREANLTRNSDLYKKLRRMKTPELKKALEDFYPTGEVTKRPDSTFRYRMLPNKPQGSCPDLEIETFTEKGIYIAALLLCVQVQKKVKL